jgi:hypothetical protein
MTPYEQHEWPNGLVKKYDRENSVPTPHKSPVTDGFIPLKLIQQAPQ